MRRGSVSSNALFLSENTRGCGQMLFILFLSVELQCCKILAQGRLDASHSMYKLPQEERIEESDPRATENLYTGSVPKIVLKRDHHGSTGWDELQG